MSFPRSRAPARHSKMNVRSPLMTRAPIDLRRTCRSHVEHGARAGGCSAIRYSAPDAARSSSGSSSGTRRSTPSSTSTSRREAPVGTDGSPAKTRSAGEHAEGDCTHRDDGSRSRTTAHRIRRRRRYPHEGPLTPGIQSVPASGTFAIAAASTVSATRSSGSRLWTCDLPHARARVCVSSVRTRR